MKITNLKIRRSQGMLYCKFDTTEGKFECNVPWKNTRGLWASESQEREPAEIAAFLRQFAAAIEAKAVAA